MATRSSPILNTRMCLPITFDTVTRLTIIITNDTSIPPLKKPGKQFAGKTGSSHFFLRSPRLTRTTRFASGCGIQPSTTPNPLPQSIAFAASLLLIWSISRRSSKIPLGTQGNARETTTFTLRHPMDVLFPAKIGTNRQNKNTNSSRVNKMGAQERCKLTVAVPQLIGCASHVLLRTLLMSQQAKKAGTEFSSPLRCAWV